MGVSIVVGGQFGSEGKGKVAYCFAKKYNASSVVRVGGINSGHTVISEGGEAVILRTLPTAAISGDVNCILPAGSYIDVALLFEEIRKTGITEARIKIHPNAVVITESLIRDERNGDLSRRIGSTASGTGAAVGMRVERKKDITLAKDVKSLAPFICDTGDFLRGELLKRREVIVEGTQGYGLSNLHSPYYPYATSRDTTAAGFLSETGLSPFDVSHIIMVIRSYPIRVAGDSGPLPKELTWEDVTKRSGNASPICEYTSVTKRVRRVGEFDKDIVLQAIVANCPDQIVLNHMDYIPGESNSSDEINRNMFIDQTQKELHTKINYIGLNPRDIYKM